MEGEARAKAFRSFESFSSSNSSVWKRGERGGRVSNPREEKVVRVIRSAGLIGYASLALSMVVVTFWAVSQSPDFPYLSRSPHASGPHASWIGAPLPVGTDAVLVDRDNLSGLRFTRRFVWQPPAGRGEESALLELRVRALNDVTLWLNGQRVTHKTSASAAAPANWNWKRGETLRVGGLIPGSNRLEAEVYNASGPPLLELSASAPGVALVTDASWSVRNAEKGFEEKARPARLAHDGKRGSAGRGGEDSWQQLADKFDTLLGIATLCGLASLALRRWGNDRLSAWFPRLCWGGVALLWLFILASKTGQLPPYWGYDGPDHLEYVRFIAERGSLPLASDGPAMYHPPLFYFLSALLVWIFPGADEGGALLRLLPFLSGLTQVAVAFLLAQRLFPGDRTIAGLSVLIAGLLPMNLYMSAFLSNEPVQAALSAIAILLVSQLLLQRGIRPLAAAALGGVIGLALLTKITALLLVPPVLVLLTLKAAVLDGASARRQLAWLGPLCATALLVAGWYYARNWIELGQPVVGNWDIPGSRVSWWQHPGFHTADYFLGFGESLRRPFFAGFHSFWDGLHATLWSDSLVGGVRNLAQRLPAWNYAWMSILPVLALPAVAIGFGGVAGLIRESLQPDDPGRRLALGFAAAIALVYGCALLLINLRLPFYAQAKASYVLAALAPLAVAGAFAVASIHRALDTPRRRPLQVVFHAWAGTLAIAVLLAFGA